MEEDSACALLDECIDEVLTQVAKKEVRRKVDPRLSVTGAWI